MEYRRILVISDLHAPFQHKDSLKFLKSIKKKYKPDLIVNIGDEISGHTISFHQHDPDIGFSPSSELEAAMEFLDELEDLFPEMEVLDSNHGSLVYRRGKHAGLPRHVLKDYAEVLDKKRWRWHKHLIVNDNIYFTHGKSKAKNALSKSVGMSVVQGHYHNSQEITYWRNAMGQRFFSMIVGCMIDNHALDFNYNKTNLDDVLLGHGIIIDGIPRLLPMDTDEHGNWNGKTP